MVREIAIRNRTLEPEGMTLIDQRIDALHAEGHDVAVFCFGDPFFNSPPSAVAGAIAALTADATMDEPEEVRISIVDEVNDEELLLTLRRAVAQYFQRTRGGIVFDIESIVTGPGASSLIFAAMMTLVDEGDEVIFPEASYPSYAQCARYAGGVPVPCPLRVERNFAIDPADIAARVTSKTRMLVLNSPHNPTGAVTTYQDLVSIAAVAEKHDLWILSDEVYSQTVFPGAEFHSIAEIPGMMDRTLLLDAVTKQLCMTGWRCGFAAVPPALAPKFNSIVHSIMWQALHPMVVSGAIAALRPNNDAFRKKILDEWIWRSATVVGAMRKMPLVSYVAEPHGGLFVYAEVCAEWRARYTVDELAHRLLEEFHIALVPSSCFGRQENYIRLSFSSGTRERLLSGLERLHKALEHLAKSIS